LRTGSADAKATGNRAFAEALAGKRPDLRRVLRHRGWSARAAGLPCAPEHAGQGPVAGRLRSSGSLKTGHVTASVALKRLVGFSAKNLFYRANRDFGRIFKTEFILQYLSEVELRRRIRRGLLKVEQLHALRVSRAACSLTPPAVRPNRSRT